MRLLLPLQKLQSHPPPQEWRLLRLLFLRKRKVSIQTVTKRPKNVDRIFRTLCGKWANHVLSFISREKSVKKKRNRAKNPHVRIRYVDFQDISSLANEEVDPFKQEIRDKLIQDAARDLTIKKELADEIKKERIQSKRDQKRRIKYAGLTRKQWQCYKLFFPSRTRKRRITLQKVAKKLGISVSSAWSRRERAKDKMRYALSRMEECKRIERSFENRSLYAGKLIKVTQLYFEKGWPPAKIAKSLHCSLSSVYKNIQTIRWPARVYAPKE